MARNPKKRQCPRCGHYFDGKLTICPEDGTRMVKKRFKMDKAAIKRVHVKALVQKGLEYETYKTRVAAAAPGKSSCTQFNQAQFRKFMADLNRLPDAPRWQRRRAA